MLEKENPKVVLSKTLQEVADFLEVELNERIDAGRIPVTGMCLRGESDKGLPVCLEVKLYVDK